MNIIKKGFGKILYGIGKLIGFLLDILIGVTEIIVYFVRSIGRGIVGLLAMGGCLFIFTLGGPFGLFLLLNPVVIMIILLLVLVPILGSKLVSYFKYIKYAITEFLYDRANYFMKGISYQFKSFDEYGNKYKRMEEEKRRKEQQRRQAEQQREWEERFKQWYEYQDSQRGSNYVNPTSEFKKKYEESCDLLGVSYNADKYEIKLAYRKKAKEFHPDINKSPNATEMFQKINSAYEFLSDGNIERYKTM